MSSRANLLLAEALRPQRKARSNKGKSRNIRSMKAHTLSPTNIIILNEGGSAVIKKARTYGPRKPRANKGVSRAPRYAESAVGNFFAMVEPKTRKPRSNKGKKKGPRSHKLANVNWGNNNNLNKGSVLNGLSKRTF